MGQVVDLMDWKLKHGFEQENDEKIRQLAKRCVDAYRLNGEKAYFNALLSAAKGDERLLIALTDKIREIVS